MECVRSRPDRRRSQRTLAQRAGRAGFAIGSWRAASERHAGPWQRLLDTDAAAFGGGDRSGPSVVTTEPVPWDGLPGSISIDLPPLTVQWLLSPDGSR